MAHPTAVAAIMDRLRDNFVAAPVFDHNSQGSVPMDGTPYVMVTWPVSNIERATVGERLYREEGGFRVVIHVERGSGTDQARAWAEDIASLFRDVKVETINCRVPGAPITHDESDQGAYFLMSFVVPFDHVFAD